MADVLSSVSAAIGIATRLKEISLNIRDAEFKNLLADLSLELADVKLKLAEVITENASLKEDNVKLREQIRNLESGSKTSRDLTYEAPFYWLMRDGKRDGPFCQKCYDSKAKRIRLQKRKDNDEWDCLECGGYFRGPNYVTPQRPPRSRDRRFLDGLY